MNPFAYITVILIWGTTPLGVQWSAEGATPFVGALLRMLLAAFVLALCLLVLRIPFPFHAQAKKIYAVSVLGQGFAMLLVYWASSFLPSSLISLIFGFSPLMTGLLSWYLHNERLSLMQCLAIVMGVMGLLLTISRNLFVHHQALDVHYFQALAAMFTACLLFSLSNVWVKRFSSNVDIHPLSMTVGSLLFALPLYLACVLYSGVGVDDIHLTSKSSGAIIYLAIFGSVLAPVCFFKVLKSTSASMVALITVVAPVIALILAAQVNHEEVGARVIAGAILVLLSLLLFQYQSYLPKKAIAV